MSKTHEYASRLVWDGDGTSNYKTYVRNHHVEIEGKPDLALSADPIFHGDATRPNPEDLFLAALSSCHLLSYLALCARNKVEVIAYEDNASGILNIEADGRGKFDEVTLRPVVTIARGQDERRAMELHDEAHQHCFIASSVSIPVEHKPVIIVANDRRTP
jgi:organic hydroperoxide reductase OsmC/OhrA